MKEIRQQFFLQRNGVLSDRLRQAGMPYEVIFGLMVPQIAEIARGIGTDAEKAQQLWDDRKCREARLLACYLWPKEGMTLESACALIDDLQTQEEADMLAFRLLKHLPFAQELVDRYAGNTEPMQRYASQILARHLQ